MLRASIVVCWIFVMGAAAVLAAPADMDNSAELAQALDSTGENRGELEAVLNHYGAGADSLKYQAAVYLIANMTGHSYVTYMLCDTGGIEIPFNALDYPTYDSLTAAFNALEAANGSLDFKRKDVAEDIKTIKADFLIEQIDRAFEAWREKPWARRLTFDQFCRYVLPYRGSNEPLESWRPFFWERYAALQTKMKDTTDPIEAAGLVNDDIISWFTFDSRYYYHPTDQGLAEMRVARRGRCEDMTNLAIFGMRSVGLAVTSDYTPAWANAGNNHAWNAILSPDGKVIPFMGAESKPGEYRLDKKTAKAYRKTYEQHPENLVFLEKKQQKVPGWLAGKSYIDVTADYTTVRDVTAQLTISVPDSVDIAYLCIFNSGEWQAVHWARIVGTAATFAAMGTDILYIPALYINEKIVPAAAPFILDNAGIQLSIDPDTVNTVSVTLVAITNPRLDTSPAAVEKTKIKPGTEYELFYWAGDWQSLGKATAADSSVTFGKVPSGALYWLQPSGSDKEERPFTLDNGIQVWW
jgi:hypothetical protein